MQLSALSTPLEGPVGFNQQINITIHSRCGLHQASVRLGPSALINRAQLWQFSQSFHLEENNDNQLAVHGFHVGKVLYRN